MNCDKELLEKLAQAAHEIWMEERLRQGWIYGPTTDKERKIHSCLVDYSLLSEADKESDRDFVRGIPRLIELAGYRLIRKD